MPFIAVKVFKKNLYFNRPYLLLLYFLFYYINPICSAQIYVAENTTLVVKDDNFLYSNDTLYIKNKIYVSKGTLIAGKINGDVIEIDSQKKESLQNHTTPVLAKKVRFEKKSIKEQQNTPQKEKLLTKVSILKKSSDIWSFDNRNNTFVYCNHNSNYKTILKKPYTSKFFSHITYSQINIYDNPENLHDIKILNSLHKRGPPKVFHYIKT